MTPEEICDRLLKLAVRLGKVVDALPDIRQGRHVAGQLIRSGTSPMPNYEEGCAAENMDDFIHKLSICLKELRESRGWVKYIVEAQLLQKRKLAGVLDECEQMCAVIGKSLVTSKRNAGRMR